MIRNVVFIGAGHVATHLSQQFAKLGISVRQVYSYTRESAKELGDKRGCPWTTSLNEVFDDVDCYVFSVKDAVLEEVVSTMKPNNGLWVHTSGSIPMSVFESCVKKYGVLYPLQTFNKEHPVDFFEIPLILEADSTETMNVLVELSSNMSKRQYALSSEQRKQIHIAAVFACNFTNHLYHLAWQLLEEKGIEADILLPLIGETAAKVHSMHPFQAQTGPAIRYDENVINKHLEMLVDPGKREIYRLLSQSIHKTSTT